MLIAGLNKTTLLDYPGHVAASIFLGGCNFRCPFCHNGGLVLSPLSQEIFTEEEIFAFLKKRKRLLKGVCITGGEPTLHTDLPEFIREIKNTGYRVKLDTNGYSPDVLKQLLEKELLDYVAMDIKNCPDKYAATAGMMDEAKSGRTFDLDKIYRSVDLLKNSSVSYEFRTTIVKEFHTKEDLVQIAEWIRGCPHYYLQQYQNSENLLCCAAEGNTADADEREPDSLCAGYFHGYTGEEMEQMAKALRQVEGMTGKIVLRMGND